MNLLENSSHYLLTPVLLEQNIVALTKGPSLFHRYLKTLQEDQNLSLHFINQIQTPESLCHSRKKLKKYERVPLSPKHPLFSQIRQVISLLQSSIFSSAESKQAAEDIRNLYQSYIQEVCNRVGKERMRLLKGPAYLSGMGQGPFLLDRNIALELSSLDTYGQSTKSNMYGSSAVRKCGDVYFKRVAAMNPLRPGISFAVDSLSNILMKEGSTPTLLIKIEGIWIRSTLDESNRAHESQKLFAKELATGTQSREFFIQYPELKKDYPFKEKRISQIIQASHAIEGTNLLEFLENKQDLFLINPYNFSLMTLLGICISPSDGRSDNYMVVAQKDGTLKCVGIDNDRSFEPHFLKQAEKHLLNLRYVFFLFPQMNHPLDLQFVERLRNCQPEFLLLEWLISLEKKNVFYQKLLENGTLNHFEFEDLGFPISLSSNSVHHIYHTLIKAKAFVKDHPDCTNWEMLHHLFPQIALIYQKLILDSNGDILKAQERLFDRNINPLVLENILEEDFCFLSPIELAETADQSPIELLLDWMGALNFNSPHEQEHFLDQLFLDFPNLKKFKLSYCALEDHSFVRIFNRIPELQELNIEQFPHLTAAGLFSLLQQHSDFHLLLGTRHCLSPHELAEVIQYAWSKNQKISLQVGSTTLSICKATLDKTMIKMLEGNHLFYAEVLCLLGANLNQKDSRGNTFLHLFAQQKTQALSFLLQHGLSPLEKNSRGATPLHTAAQTEYVENIPVLIQAGARLEDKDLDGKTALHYALIQGQINTVHYLIELGADPKAVTFEQDTCLHMAVSKDLFPLVSLFAALTPDFLNRGDNDGKTPLHKAVWENPKPHIVKFLLSKGASPHAQNNYEYTPLHWAAKHGHLESARLLLAYQADCTFSNRNGDTPLDLSIKWGTDEVFRCLLMQGMSSSDSKGKEKEKESEIEMVPFSEESSSFSSSQYSYANLYLQFEKAYETGNLLNQLFCLEKLATHYEKDDVVRAAHLLNAALSLAQKHYFSPLYQKYLLSKLERFEGFFLEQLDLKTPAHHRGYIENYRARLNTIREQANIQIGEGVSLDTVLKELTQSYRDLLQKLISSSIDLLSQDPPCAFAVIALGSMARYEMCPYSSIEFAILVEKKSPEIHDYFVRLSRFLELRMINMGETERHLLLAKRQPDETMRDDISFVFGGFSMDNGGMSPLGKPGVYELIGTPKAIAAYQDPVWLQKHTQETLFVHALTQSSLIMGEEKLLRLYETKMGKWLEPEPLSFRKKIKLREQRALHLLQEQTQEFKPHLIDKKVDIRALDIKKDLYRPFQIFIDSLLLYHGYKRQGVIVGIEILEAKRIIGAAEAAQLKTALNQILMLRVRAHFFYQKKQEILCNVREHEGRDGKGLYLISSEELDTILEIYRVLIPFHQAMKNFLKNPNFSVLKKASLYDATLEVLLDDQSRLSRPSEAVAKYPKVAPVDSENLETPDHLPNLQSTLEKDEEVLEDTEEQFEKVQPIQGDEVYAEFAMYMSSIANALKNLGRHEESLNYKVKALEVRKETFEESHLDMAISLNNGGELLFQLKRYKEAHMCFLKALGFSKEIFEGNHPVTAKSLNNTGGALIQLGRNQEALIYAMESLEMRRRIFGNKHSDVLKSLNNVAYILSSLGRHEEAAGYQAQAIKLEKEISKEKTL